MKLLKFLLRVFLSPFMLVLTLIQLILTFIIGLASWLLSIAATILFIVAIFVFFSEGIKAGISILIIAWLISPYGVPLFAQWIVDKTVDIKFFIKDKIS